MPNPTAGAKPNSYVRLAATPTFRHHRPPPPPPPPAAAARTLPCRSHPAAAVPPVLCPYLIPVTSSQLPITQ